MDTRKDDTPLAQNSSFSHVNESGSSVFPILNGKTLEIGFLIGLLALVVTTFVIFYYALPTLSNSIVKAQKSTESSFKMTV